MLAEEVISMIDGKEKNDGAEKKSAAIISTVKTATFKIKHPSKRKRAALQRAIYRYNYHYDLVSEYFKKEVIEFGEKYNKDKNEARDFIRSISGRVNRKAYSYPIALSHKSGIVKDYIANASSYLELLRVPGMNPCYYQPMKINNDYEKIFDTALDDLSTSTTLEDENDARNRISLSKQRNLRPISIFKNDAADGILLLELKKENSDSDGRLGLLVNLYAKNDRSAKIRAYNNAIDTRTGEEFKKKTSTTEIFHLECSKWHVDNYLNKSDRYVEKPKILSSRIYEKNGDFYFDGAFEFKTEKIEPKTILAIDRGIQNLAALSVLDFHGKVLYTEVFSGEELRAYQRRAEARSQNLQKRGKKNFGVKIKGTADRITNTISKRIAEIAREYKSIVVMEDLKNISNGPHQRREKGKRRSNFRRMLNRQQYQKIKDQLSYKLNDAGIGEKIIEVSAAYTSQTCSKCFHLDRENRLTRDCFLCTNCGYEIDADVNASVVIGLKGIHFKKVISGRKKGQKLSDKEKFHAWLERGLGRASRNAV